MTQMEVANSNIIALVATLLVRLVAGPCCDRWGPRKTFAGTLLLGALPTFLAGTTSNAQGLYALRFFIGILGGSFVPCQVWTTGFYDKNVVGTANALTGGLGNMGGGITYLLMPHVYTSLVSDGLTPHVAWRVSFVVPGVVIVATAVAMLLCCQDTPTGKWSDRGRIVEEHAKHDSGKAGMVNVPGTIAQSPEMEASSPSRDGQTTPLSKELKKDEEAAPSDSTVGDQQILDTAKEEVVRKPTMKEMLRVIATPQTLVLGACYFNSFGAELSINSILDSYYAKNFPTLDITSRGDYAAMFGLLNGAFRPMGGLLSDFVYRKTGSLWAKKELMHIYGVLMGASLILIGALDPTNQSTMFGLVVLVAFFLEGGNGLNFSLVPHVCPYANGIVSGFTGASGNLGGVVFAIIFRYQGTDYAKVFWIIGVISIAMNLAACWIRPIPKGQIGGR